MLTANQTLMIAAVLACYALAAGAALMRLGRPEAIGRLPGAAVLAGGAALAAGLLGWRVVAGDGLGAIGTPFDAMTLAALLVAVEALLFGLDRRLVHLDAFLAPLAAALQLGAFGMIGPARTAASSLTVFHAAAFAAAGSCFLAAGVAGAMFVLMHRRLRGRPDRQWFGRFPPLEALQLLGRRMLLAALPLTTVGLLIGAWQLQHTEQMARAMGHVAGTVVLWLAAATVLGVSWLRPSKRGVWSAWAGVLVAALWIVDFVMSLAWRAAA